MSEAVIWHDVECGDYTADLALWEELVAGCSGPLLELGCGAGRVVSHLAERTDRLLVGIDCDPSLVEALRERSSARPVGSLQVERADARHFALGHRFELILAPMQLIQLLDGYADRIACLACVSDHLLPGGRAAIAIVEQLAEQPVEGLAPPAPDVREVERRVYSSLPLPPEPDGEAIVLRRLRQTLDSDGMLGESVDEIALQRISAETLEREAREVGLEPIGRRVIPATEAHVGSTVVLLGREE